MPEIDTILKKKKDMIVKVCRTLIKQKSTLEGAGINNPINIKLREFIDNPITPIEGYAEEIAAVKDDLVLLSKNTLPRTAIPLIKINNEENIFKNFFNSVKQNEEINITYQRTEIKEFLILLEKRDEKEEMKKQLKSIHLITNSFKPNDAIFLVLDENFNIPIRCPAKNIKGEDTYIKKLHNIAYLVNAPDKKVIYSKTLADRINNGLFRKIPIAKYLRTNNFKKPTLVKKSEDKTILVLKNEILIKIDLVKNIPSQYQYLYIDKTQ